MGSRSGPKSARLREKPRKLAADSPTAHAGEAAPTHPRTDNGVSRGSVGRGTHPSGCTLPRRLAAASPTLRPRTPLHCAPPHRVQDYVRSTKIYATENDRTQAKAPSPQQQSLFPTGEPAEARAFTSPPAACHAPAKEAWHRGVERGAG